MKSLFVVGLLALGACAAPPAAAPRALALPEVRPIGACGSAARSASPHCVKPAGHWIVHVPSTHVWPAAHRTPHAPQLSGSNAVGVQPSGHAIMPFGQVVSESNVRLPHASGASNPTTIEA